MVTRITSVRLWLYLYDVAVNVEVYALHIHVGTYSVYCNYKLPVRA